MLRRARRRRSLQPVQSFNFAPMVDIVLLLLIFFMSATTIIEPSRALRVDLPGAQTGRSVSQLPEVYLSSDGQLAFGGAVGISLDQLEVALRKALPGTNGAVSLKADRNTAHGQVVAVMDTLRRAGATRIAVGTRNGQ
jgi:biopolymer transport protein ExbD